MIIFAPRLKGGNWRHWYVYEPPNSPRETPTQILNSYQNFILLGAPSLTLKFLLNFYKSPEIWRFLENLRQLSGICRHSGKIILWNFKIPAKYDWFWQNHKYQIFCTIWEIHRITGIVANLTLNCAQIYKYWVWSSAEECKSCRSRKMRLVAIGGVDTAENGPDKVWDFLISS
jgi:hypothetical protein